MAVMSSTISGGALAERSWADALVNWPEARVGDELSSPSDE